MQWLSQQPPVFERAVITIGNFDGLHLGHQKLLQRLVEEAQAIRGIPVVLTYLEHPGHYMHKDDPVPILTPRFCKIKLIQRFGVEEVFHLNFSLSSSKVSAEEFLAQVLVGQFHPAVILAGHDSHFGYQRTGTPEFLRQHQNEFGYRSIQIEPVYYEGQVISSTLIRQTLKACALDQVTAMLGRPYRLYGQVVHGLHIGAKICFPTINLQLIDREQLIPEAGVYLSAVKLQGVQFFGLTNIGFSPTVKSMAKVEIETHLLDFQENVYNRRLELDLLSFIRAEKEFDSVSELQTAIRRDIAQGREMADRYRPFLRDLACCSD